MVGTPDDALVTASQATSGIASVGYLGISLTSTAPADVLGTAGFAVGATVVALTGLVSAADSVDMV